MGKPAESAELSPDMEALFALVRRAEKGDLSVMPALTAAMANPDVVNRIGGNLTNQARAALLERFTNGHPVIAEAVPRRMAQLSSELGAEGAPALERLLIGRVVTCWMHLHLLEGCYAQQRNLSLPQADFYQRCIDRAHRRYLSAIKALAQVRRLARPAMQFNIAEKQVNVAR